MAKTSKVDLTLVKRLVSELEAQMALADKVELSTEKTDWVVEMNKAAGLAAGLMTEAGLLVGDIQHIIGGMGMPTGGKGADYLDKILGGLKGPGTNN